MIMDGWKEGRRKEGWRGGWREGKKKEKNGEGERGEGGKKETTSTLDNQDSTISVHGKLRGHRRRESNMVCSSR